MEFVEEVAESSSLPRSYAAFGGGGSGGGGSEVIRNDVYNRLIEIQNEEAISTPDFRDQLEAHFNRLPQSYGLDINLDRVEDVLLHQKLLERAKDPTNRPVFHIRLMENVSTSGDDLDGELVSTVPPMSLPCDTSHVDVQSPNERNRNSGGESDTFSKLGDLNLEVGNDSGDIIKENSVEEFSERQEAMETPIHEVIFSTIGKPKLLSQVNGAECLCFVVLDLTSLYLKTTLIDQIVILFIVMVGYIPLNLLLQFSAFLSNIGLNIREAHVFSTTDGYCLDVFVVDGWYTEDMGRNPNARVEGQVDSGIVDMRANTIELQGTPKTVHVDSMSGASTMLFTFTLDRGLRWESASKLLEEKQKDESMSSNNGFYESRRELMGTRHYVLALEKYEI